MCPVQDEHGKPAKSEEEVKAFDADFTKVDQGVLFELILVRALRWRCGALLLGCTLGCPGFTRVAHFFQCSS